MAVPEEPLLADAQEMAGFGVWRCEVATGALLWSEGLYRVFGLTSGAVEPSFEAWLGIVHTDDQTNVKSYLTHAHRNGEAMELEYRIHRPGGEVRTLFGRVRGRFDETGRLVSLTGMEQDITDYIEVKARIAFSDRMVALGTLAGGVAHEINNPLAIISSNLQFLGEDGLDDKDEMIRDARAAVERIRTVVRGMMAFSQADDDTRSPVDIHHVLELALTLVDNDLRRRARLVKRFDAIPPVHASDARLGHVFINLLANAVHAIPEGHPETNEIRLTTRTDASGWAIIEISDTGVGLSLATQRRIFDPFYTTKPVGRGTGLGLSVCHGIVRSFGGDISVQSVVGKGSTFTIALPPSEPRPAAIVSAESPGGAVRRSHVLIVDDEVSYSTSLRRLLRHEHDVTIINDSREALRRLHAGEHFDVILCDLMMPGLSGADLHATLLAERPEQVTRMIFITGGAFTSASQAFLAGVQNPVFEKPCDLEELRAAIRRVALQR